MSANRRIPVSNLSPPLCAKIARSTLKAVEDGSYTLSGQTYSLPDSAKGTEFFDSTALSNWSTSPRPETPRIITQTHVTILEMSTLEAAHLISKSDPISKVGILNFASPLVPGGGFIGGALTQEESIARSSTLYQSLTSETARQYYDSHTKNAQGGYFSHAMIFSPNVTLFRDDAGEWIQPLGVSVVTSPAVHAGLVQQGPNKEHEIELSMKERMARILYLFESRGVSKLVLGSFGTGVYQNPVPMVARIWAELLGVPGSRFSSSFNTVVFGILGGETYDKFKETFDRSSLATLGRDTNRESTWTRHFRKLCL